MTNPTVDRDLRRPALIGFGVGFAAAFVVTVLALMLTAFETLEPVLVPGALLLSPLEDSMAGWNGLVNMLLAGAVNGVVYAAVFTLVAAGLSAVRRRA